MLEIFPQSSLDNSILTSVLVGLVFVWFFQERFGWGLSGLVVPGYLASIFVIQPISGLVIVLEAVATYLLVVALSETVPRWWPYTTLFGRDRFFNILLVSVGVRLVLEGGGIDANRALVGERPNEDLHSMGLVVVPLAANSLWRYGTPARSRARRRAGAADLVRAAVRAPRATRTSRSRASSSRTRTWRATSCRARART
jgi:hypothetical protein